MGVVLHLHEPLTTILGATSDDVGWQLQFVRGPHRTLLRENWSLRAAPAGGPAAAPPDPQSGWLPIASALPVAAALRERGEWSLDGPPTAFDAQDWWYRLRFDAPRAQRGEQIVLGFDGLATLAEVTLNGQPLFASDNMFVAHECDVGARLRPAGNELLIRCRALEPELARRRPRPRWRTPMVAHQQLRWFRTTLLGRTPGWSPPAPAVGPWRDVWLERRDRLHVDNLRTEAFVEGTTGVVRCRLEMPGAGGDAMHSVTLELERGGHVHVQRLSPCAAGQFAGELKVPNAALWWPHTHGEPCLYQAALRIRAADGSESRWELPAIGFRTVELDSAGGEFQLRVNGVPVFCRGACWTPLDAASLRSSAQACRDAVAQAGAAGMNMLRVAGTTVYEEDHFYDACDELGLLVWQEFMFASMDYPAGDPAFAASAVLEARQQLQRLHARPCLAVLCGNSEVQQQAAMWGAPREQWRSAFFEETLAQLCAEHAPSAPYWPSSAHGGAFPHQADAGTTSYYGVGAYLRPLHDARRSGLRFATECLAFANIPGERALERMPGGLATRVHHPAWKARSPRDLGAGWDFDDVRDHYLRTLFGVDPQQLRYADHERYLALGRMATGEAMAAAFAEWRRPASACRGALVLWLRDLWAGAGWGVVDESGAPKACYHYLKRALRPLAVLLTDEGGNGLAVHVINETAQDRQLELELIAWRDGDVQVARGELSLLAQARSARTLSCIDLLPHFMDLSYAYRFGPLPCDAVVVTLRDPLGVQLAQAFHFPGGLGAQPRIDVGLRASVSVTGERTAQLLIATDRLAQGVHIDIPGFEPEDDYFHLAPGAEAHVTLRGAAGAAPSGAVHAINSSRSTRVAPEPRPFVPEPSQVAPAGEIPAPRLA
jgi:beta-mannosidase